MGVAYARRTPWRDRSGSIAGVDDEALAPFARRWAGRQSWGDARSRVPATCRAGGIGAMGMFSQRRVPDHDASCATRSANAERASRAVRARTTIRRNIP